MAAAMREIPFVSCVQWIGCEPTGRGHELLARWGDFRRGRDRLRCESIGGNAFAPRIDRAYADEPDYVIAIDDVLRDLRYSVRMGKVYVRITKRFYLNKDAPWEIAGMVRRTEGFVRLSINGVIAKVEREIPEA